MSLPYPVRQLAELCVRHPLTPKILLVPGVRAGYDLTTALARRGCQWTNLRVTTPALLAAGRLAPRMAALGVHRLSTDGRRRLVENLLDSWPVARRQYFIGRTRDGSVDAGLVDPMQSTLDALRLAKVLPEHIAGLAAVDGAAQSKMVDLAFLYAAYTKTLHDGGWWDDAALFTEALQEEHAPTGSGGPMDYVWAILDETELSPLAAEYVRSLTKGQMWRLGRRAYGVPPPPASAARQFPAAPIPNETPIPATEVTSPSRHRPTASAARLKGRNPLVQGDLFLDPLREAGPESPQLYALGATQSTLPEAVEVSPGGRLLTTSLMPGDGDRVRLCQVVGLETEVRFVLRDIFQRDLPYDDVEIVYTATAPYQALLHDAVQRWDLPADFAAGVPAVMTRPGRSLAAFLEWIATDLDVSVLVRHLLAREIDWADDDAPPGAVARWLLQGRASAGPLATLAALDRLAPAIGSADTAASTTQRDETLRRRLAAGRAQLQRLFALAAAAGQAPGVAAAALTYLQALPSADTDEGGQQDRRIRDTLVGLLQDQASLPASEAPPGVQAQRLLSVLRRYSCEASRAGAGRVQLSPLPDAGYCGRRHLYILGLDETRFPGNPGQDPILLDEERRALSPLLPVATNSATEGIFHLIRVLGSAAGTVTLIASRMHFADGREPYPTPLFERACRQLQRLPDWGGPVPADGVADDLEALWAQRTHPDLPDALARVFPDAARGVMSARARTHAAPSRFSGWIAQADVESLDLSGQRILSNRMLETLAECPRRYLLRYGLGLVPPDEPRSDPRRWLQPLEMGNLLHGLFLSFMQQLQGTRPDTAHQPRLQEMVEAAIAAQRHRVPVTLVAAYRNDCRRIERAAHIFLHAESQRLAADPALHPAAFELDFGSDEVVEVRLSHDIAFRLRGRIDRVDAVFDASGETVAYEIWDYKTGSTFAFDSAALAQGGRRLQWALYAYALPHLLAGDVDVRLSGYFFASDRGSGQRFSDAPPARHELAAMLQPLFAMARQGFFPALHKGDGKGGGPCRFCDYRRICASEARGAEQIDGLFAAAAEMAALVDGWAEVVSSGRTGSRQTLEVAFKALGLAPGDVAPEDVAGSARQWIRT